jgi:16S rRNA (cytidine1402-2'-O)-methyltransferase
MPLNSPIHKYDNTRSIPGKLYVVATPIGNREDITLRALRILQEADWIAAEDTRHTRRFLQHHNISGRLIAYHEHNEKKQTPSLIEKLKQGASVALVSEAGTPAVSDPGFRLVRAAIEEGLEVVPIPGASAAVSALCVSGLPTDAFVFIGFLPKKKGERLKQLQALSGLSQTLIFYESPRRILALIQEIQSVMENRCAVLCREMTKLHEEILRGTLLMLRDELEKRPEIKGECTLLVAGETGSKIISREDIRVKLKEALHQNNVTLSEVVKKVAGEFGLSRRAVYEEALRIKDGIH